MQEPEVVEIKINEDGTYAEPVSLRSGDRLESVREVRVDPEGREFEKVVAIRIIRRPA